MTGGVLALQIIRHVNTLDLPVDLAASVCVIAELIVQRILGLGADSPGNLHAALLALHLPFFQGHWSTVLHYRRQTDLCKQLYLLDPAFPVSVDWLGSWRWRWCRVQDRGVMEDRGCGWWRGASGGKKRRWGTSVGDWMNHRGVTEDGTGNRRRVG